MIYDAIYALLALIGKLEFFKKQLKGFIISLNLHSSTFEQFSL